MSTCCNGFLLNAPVAWSDQVHYWVPPVPNHSRRICQPSSSLNIALLAGERVFAGLRPEANLLLLTPDNFADILVTENPALLLIESCFRDVTGQWIYAQTIQKRSGKLLGKMLSLARELNIPTAYWFTLDHIYLRHFGKIFSLFDHVFCADPLAASILAQQGYHATTLFPAIQPVVHHPIRVFAPNQSFAIDTLYDGWADLLYYGNRLPLPQPDMFGLRIIDSRNQIPTTCLDRMAHGSNLVLGSVSLPDRLTTLRHTTAAISLDQSLAPRTEQHWMSVETAACRVPLVHLGNLAGDDPRRSFSIVTDTLTAMKVSLARLLEEPVYREETAQQYWRETHLHHSFARRLERICAVLEIELSIPSPPLASIITPTNRPEKIGQVLATYARQEYPAKELIIVYNGSPVDFPAVQEQVANRCDRNIIVQNLPTDYFAGAALNIGASLARGSYCFRMDDDDHYADTYISDMMLHLGSVDADIFGKPPVHLLFENEQELYLRWSSAALSLLPNHLVRSEKVRLGGNTIAGKTEVLREMRYPDTVFGTADSAFLIEAAHKKLSFYAFDQSGVLAGRRSNEDHTWKCDNRRLKDQAEPTVGLPADVLSPGSRPNHDTTKTYRARFARKNILFFGPEISDGGIWQNRVRYIYPDLLSSLADHFTLHMLTGPMPPYAVPGLSELREKYGIIFHALSPRKKTEPYLHWIRGGTQYAKKISADLLTNIFGGILFGYALTIVARQMHIPGIIRVAGDEIASRIAIGTYLHKKYFPGCKQYQVDLRRQLLAFSRADRIIVMSPWERDRVIGQGATPDKVRIVIRGVDLEKFTPAGKETKRARKFLFVGRNSLEKGFDIIEKAAIILERSHPELEFVFAGNFSPGKTGNRRYLGFVKTEDLPELYRSVDAFILSSRTEGMPQVVLEAMASGIPCILSRHLFETMFSDGVEALLTELNPEHLARHVVRLHENVSLASRLGQAGRKFAERHFDREKLKNDYLDLFLELLDSGVSPKK